MKTIVDKQSEGYVKYEKGSADMDFKSKDLATVIAHASMEYSGVVCKDVWGQAKLSLKIKIFDTYDFHYEWFNPITKARLFFGNTLARTSQIFGAIVPYDWSVNFTEHGESLYQH